VLIFFHSELPRIGSTVKMEQSELEIIYTNTTHPGFENYSNAISLKDEYPMD
jgi:hypothetical protein